MPLLKHAKKKLRQDKKRTLGNKKVKNLFKSMVKKAKENPTPQAISEAASAIDKATKYNLMHENKAARMKSALSKLTTEGVAAKKAAAKKDIAASKANKKKTIKRNTSSKTKKKK